MSPELDKKLVEKYPKIFKDRYADMKSTCMFWGIDCGDGWYNIIDKMCGLIAWDVEHNKMPEVVATQVKEKFSSMRFYYQGGNERTQGIVDMAEQMSGITCEVCGLPGKHVNLGWQFTLCEKHAEEYARERGIQLNHFPWLNEVYDLVSANDSDKAIDVLFENVESLFSNGDYIKCDDLMNEIDLSKLDTNLLVAVLSILKPKACSFLWWHGFMDAVVDRLTELAPSRVDALVKGLV